MCKFFIYKTVITIHKSFNKETDQMVLPVVNIGTIYIKKKTKWGNNCLYLKHTDMEKKKKS